MQCYRLTIKPLSPFATTLKGDTLFGQLCWAVRNRYGESFLQQCLEGYTDNRPFAIIGDAFPQTYWPLPKLPGIFFKKIEDLLPKQAKKRNWLPESRLKQPISEWLQYAKTDSEVAADNGFLTEKHSQPHNTINRQTGTTGENGFAPYNVEQQWYQPDMLWEIILLFNENRISLEQIYNCLSDIGLFGYGKDASIGAGKFNIKNFCNYKLPSQENANACLTLAPVAPQSLGYSADASYYQTFTRFGRHGDRAVHDQGKPFKNPILLAQTAAIFTTPPPKKGFIGQGLGGKGELSKTLNSTVHQAYAPVIAVNFVNKKPL